MHVLSPKPNLNMIHLFILYQPHIQMYAMAQIVSLSTPYLTIIGIILNLVPKGSQKYVS